ncbi:uncharacterized protein LOC128198988 isoform X3 [Bicyclus anynana]|uniref:Uncharacterized protein LOC128198988 isoform X3 n=1 Tax=Bicyclus anynana TaxID=110368 RepID=A0ABM3LVM7_BICAN|nr:uncharacterized protein LOC128198988 isoform X3 [Bicyclus anynana]
MWPGVGTHIYSTTRIFLRTSIVQKIKAYPVQLKPMKGCPCGNDGICKQKITPKGVTIHYPQKKKKFGNMQINKPNIFTAKCEKGYSETPRPKTNVKLIKQKKSTFWKV